MANADTPGYQAKDLEFQVHLDALLGKDRGPQLRRTHQDHFPNRVATRLVTGDDRHFHKPGAVAEPQFQTSEVVTVGNDGNSVDTEREMVRLAETQLAYATLARLISGRIESLRLMARDGR